MLTTFSSYWNSAKGAVAHAGRIATDYTANLGEASKEPVYFAGTRLRRGGAAASKTLKSVAGRSGRYLAYFAGLRVANIVDTNVGFWAGHRAYMHSSYTFPYGKELGARYAGIKMAELFDHPIVDRTTLQLMRVGGYGLYHVAQYGYNLMTNHESTPEEEGSNEEAPQKEVETLSYTQRATNFLKTLSYDGTLLALTPLSYLAGSVPSSYVTALMIDAALPMIPVPQPYAVYVVLTTTGRVVLEYRVSEACANAMMTTVTPATLNLLIQTTKVTANGLYSVPGTLGTLFNNAQLEGSYRTLAKLQTVKDVELGENREGNVVSVDQEDYLFPASPPRPANTLLAPEEGEVEDSDDEIELGDIEDTDEGEEDDSFVVM